MESLTLAVALAVLQQVGPPGQPPPFPVAPLPEPASFVAPGTVSPQWLGGAVPARPASALGAQAIVPRDAGAGRVRAGSGVPAGLAVDTPKTSPAPGDNAGAGRPAATDTPVVRRPRAVEYSRSLHRTIAISSMGVALVAYAIMLPPFRR